MTPRRFSSVAVIMGGPSKEAEVSLRSGAAVARALASLGYRVTEVRLTGVELEIPEGVEAVFIALHGFFGEDGQIQELLERWRMPYTGTGPRGSCLAMNKIAAKQAMLDAGIPTPDYEIVRPGGLRTLPLPVVVKPPSEGSSIGISRVMTEDAWPAALETALKHGDEALVERCILGRELTVGVIEGENGPMALPLVEIEAPNGDYDFRAKYLSRETRYLAPAPLDEETTAWCQDLGLRVFDALEGRGLGRVDIRLDLDNRPFVLELNTIPGFTETSLLPKAAAAAGFSFEALCGLIMETASLKEPGE